MIIIIVIELDVAVNIYNSIICEMGTGGSGIQGHSLPVHETLSQKPKLLILEVITTVAKNYLWHKKK